MTIVETPSRDELEARKAAILQDLGMSAAELRNAAAHGGLVGAEWSAWSEVRDLDFLLGDDE